MIEYRCDQQWQNCEKTGMPPIVFTSIEEMEDHTRFGWFDGESWGKRFATGEEPKPEAPPEEKEERCRDFGKDFRDTGKTITCYCSPGATQNGVVWGSGIYAYDSRICRSALHAGAVGAEGGLVRFTVSAGRASYQGSYANGVESLDYGPMPGSISFGTAPKQQRKTCPGFAREYRGTGRTLSCFCPASDTNIGSVWGTGVYTDDSGLCHAAVHAGMIGGNGGEVTFSILPGRSSYVGSRANGVDSLNYGPWHGSVSFGTGAPAQIEACPRSASDLRGSNTTLTCSCTPAAIKAGFITGDGIYSDDSSICSAARHAGVIGASGGQVTFQTRPGLSEYKASVRNGIMSMGYGGWDGSFVFVPGN
jgi:hypothetical protein